MEKKAQLLLYQGLGILICIILIIVIISIPTFFEFTWNQQLRDLLPGMEYFFRYVTEFGGTLTYMAIFFAIFWGIDKDMGKSLFSVYVFGSTVNYYVKGFINTPRPPQSSWWLISASHFSTPSGHAMSTTFFWGYLALRFKRIIMWVLTIVIIVLVGLSRMYLGVHWLGDILTGWLFGIIILILTWMLAKPLSAVFSRINLTYVYLGVALLGLGLMILTQIFYSHADVSDFGSDGGKIIGFGLGLALEHQFVKFEIGAGSGKTWKITLRVMLGMLLFTILFLALYLLLDTDIWYMEALQFIISLVYGIFLWPLIFKKLKL